MLTREQVEKALPATLKSAATQQFTDLINQIVGDPIVAEHVRENFISYAGVLKDGKFKTEDYLHAVVYVSYKLMGCSNQDAYAQTFPTRYQALVAKGVSAKDISAYVSAYHKGKLVNLILQQSLVPFWVLNQEYRQKALNVQVDLMLNAKSEKVRSDAANSVLTHLEQPKEVGPLVSIAIEDNAGVAELRAMLSKLAQDQRSAIGQGIPAKDIAGQQIRDVIDQDGNIV